MLRTSIILAASLLLAAPAFADGVHVSVDGKDAATLRKDIVKAAHEVCADEPQTGPFYNFVGSDKDYCIRHTVEAALTSAHDLQVARNRERANAPVVVGSR